MPDHSGSQPNWLLIVLAGIAVLWVLKYIRLSRESIRPIFRHFAIGFVLGLLYYASWGQKAGYNPATCGVVFGILAAIIFHQKRRRYIPNAVRRAVKARDFKGREHKYNSKKYHYDHRVPFSKGGSHTIDNIRLIDATKNLKKGAKSPTLWDMFFR